MVAGNPKWRTAYPNILVSDEGLSSMQGDFPSLEANDFCVYYEAKGDKEVAAFVRRLAREMVFAYDGWAKALRDSNADALMADLINGATKEEYTLVRRYLVDYCKANNLHPEAAVQIEVDKPDYSKLAAEIAA